MRDRLIKLLAAAISISGLLMLIIPILIYEAISDLKWKATKNERCK
jgi:hypothetical protein